MESVFNKKFEKLTEIVRGYNKSVDLEMLRAAYEFAKVAHIDIIRLSGDSDVDHVLETALLLADWKMDQSTIIAGLLHDSVEHGAATNDDILKNFGEEVSKLVDGVTSVSKVELKGSSDEIFVENLRKMFLAISKDLRIVFLRLAERVDNLKTIEFLPEARKLKYARESLEIYAPLAERLGMWQVKSVIDDLAFKHAYPLEYKRVLELSESAYKNAERRILKIKKRLLKELHQEGVEAKVLGRKKGFYSLFNKLRRPEINWNINEVQDIVALRVLVNTVKDCYVTLGVLHKYYKPVPSVPIADFIAVPKPNGYRSIHSKVHDEEGKIVEVQIRTYLMHDEAEHGVASHWQMAALKSSGKIGSDQIDKGEWKTPKNKLSWVKELANWQNEISDSEEFLKAVKFDALSKRIFVFSPKGDVYDLPENSTPLDFAYAIHTGLGLYTKGAIVDKKIVPLNYKLRSGQVVEILKHKDPQKPKSDWLNIAVTTAARREIKKQLWKGKN